MTKTFIILLVLIIILIVYFVAAYVCDHRVDGYYMGTNAYNKFNGLTSSAIYLRGERLSLLLHMPDSIAIQLYKIRHSWFGHNISVEPIRIPGAKVNDLLPSEVTMDIIVDDNGRENIVIRDGKSVLFMGMRLKDTTPAL
jgi:hypothetical protein